MLTDSGDWKPLSSLSREWRAQRVEGTDQSHTALGLEVRLQTASEGVFKNSTVSPQLRTSSPDGRYYSKNPNCLSSVGFGILSVEVNSKFA